MGPTTLKENPGVILPYVSVHLLLCSINTSDWLLLLSSIYSFQGCPHLESLLSLQNLLLMASPVRLTASNCSWLPILSVMIKTLTSNYLLYIAIRQSHRHLKFNISKVKLIISSFLSKHVLPPPSLLTWSSDTL